MPGKKSSEETETEMETEDRGTKVNKKEEQYCAPLLLHLRAEGGRSIVQVPSRNQS